MQASSLFLVSRLNCSITTSDGTVLSSNTNNCRADKLLMTDDTDTAQRSRLRTRIDTGELDRTDRILLGVVRRGLAGARWARAWRRRWRWSTWDRGTRSRRGSPDTPWLLYAVIAISAAVIIGAVPLLLRARRAALEEPPPAARATRCSGRDRAAPPPVRGAEAPTEKLRVPRRRAADPRSARLYRPASRSRHAPRPADDGGGPAVAALRRGHRDAPWVSRWWPSVSPPI